MLTCKAITLSEGEKLCNSNEKCKMFDLDLAGILTDFP